MMVCFSATPYIERRSRWQMLASETGRRCLRCTRVLGHVRHVFMALTKGVCHMDLIDDTSCLQQELSREPGWETKLMVLVKPAGWERRQ